MHCPMGENQWLCVSQSPLWDLNQVLICHRKLAPLSVVVHHPPCLPACIWLPTLSEWLCPNKDIRNGRLLQRPRGTHAAHMLSPASSNPDLLLSASRCWNPGRRPGTLWEQTSLPCPLSTATSAWINTRNSLALTLALLEISFLNQWLHCLGTKYVVSGCFEGFWCPHKEICGAYENLLH